MDQKSQGLKIRIRQNASVKEKTLIRVVAETLKKVVHYYQIKNAEEILSSSEIQAMRYKLKECLNRLIFLEPLEFGQKAEDTIWKSIFYEPIRIFKKELKNKPSLINCEPLLLVAFQRHILGAIGYYQKLIIRLQTEFGLTKVMCPHFSQFVLNDGDEEKDKDISPELKSWAFSCIQHSLLYIGDLYRYENDIKCTNARVLSTRYYNFVLSLNPSLGHAYNQLATLDTLSYYGLNAAYYYLKAQLCSNSFCQAKENLLILFERNVKRLRSVLDRESLMKKSGSNVSKSGLKIIRVKSCIIKYLNVWHLFTTPNEMNHYDMKQLAGMCDDVLNILSFVLGFDRKLVSSASSPDNGVRPSSLNVKIVTQVLFIANSCLEIIRQNFTQDSDDDQLKSIYQKFDLAHSFVLNLYGHVFNQCLVRIRDELRGANIEISLMFRRYECCEERETINEEIDTINTIVSQPQPQQSITKPKKKRMALSKRLVRARQDTDDTNNDEDLSEGELNFSESDNLLWDDQYSTSSDEENYNENSVNSELDEDGNPRGFGVSDLDEETDFESNEEIHSQDEDDQIIRAIVGHNTVFGRNQLDRDQKPRNKESSNQVIFSEPFIDETQQPPPESVKSSKHKKQQEDNNKIPLFVKPSVDTLLPSLTNVDLLQPLSLLFNQFGSLSDELQDSFCRVLKFAPFLWKHFVVLLNFCENALDDFQQSDITSIQCCHINRDIRSTMACKLPEDREISIDADTGLGQMNKCGNQLHQAISRALRVLQCGHRMASLTHGPINVIGTPNSCRWTLSCSQNAPRTNLISKSWNQIYSMTDNSVSVSVGNTEREKMMREMARLRLKNELSSSVESDDNRDADHKQKSRSPSREGMCAVYMIPDVEFICTRLDVIKLLVRSERYIFVIPRAVLQRLDRIKTQDHGARQATKYLEGEMQINNEHINIESNVSSKVPDMSCDFIKDWAGIEATALRLVDESVGKSTRGHDLVVTILTESVSKLSNQFIEHYATRRINFQSNINL